MKNGEMTIYILPTKTRGCAPQSPETKGNDENNVPQTKPGFAKNRVFATLKFRRKRAFYEPLLTPMTQVLPVDKFKAGTREHTSLTLTTDPKGAWRMRALGLLGPLWDDGFPR